jgi:hypothetical protein
MVKKHCIRVTPPRIIAELAILFHTSSTTMYILELPPCHPRQKWKERWHKVKVGIWRSRSLSFLNIDRDSYRICKARATAGDGVVNYESGIAKVSSCLCAKVKLKLMDAWTLTSSARFRQAILYGFPAAIAKERLYLFMDPIRSH